MKFSSTRISSKIDLVLDKVYQNLCSYWPGLVTVVGTMVGSLRIGLIAIFFYGSSF